MSEEEIEIPQYEGEFEVGSYITIRPPWIHRIEAMEDCVFVEASTNELWDVVRIKDDYNREDD